MLHNSTTIPTTRSITFKWSGAIISGKILSQKPSSIQGQCTVVQGDDGVEYTLYGKCEPGQCGPFYVLSID